MDSEKSRVFVWRVTQDCNLNCRFCSYSQDLSRLRSRIDPERVLRFGQVLGEYSRLMSRSVLVSWIGGEPLLWPDLFDVSRRFVRDYGLSVSMTTNGVPLRSTQVQERIVDDFSEIVISIDGFSDVNDWGRQKSGLFNELKSSITALVDMKQARSKPLILKVNTIIMRKNVEHFEAFCEYLADLGVQELTFNQLGGYDRPEFYPDNRLLASQVADFMHALPAWNTYFASKGLCIHGSDAYLHRFDYSSRDLKIPIEDCIPGEWFWFINENGLASPCSYTSYEYAVDIDSIHAPAEIDTVENVFRAMRASRRSKFCDDCHCTQLYDKFA